MRAMILYEKGAFVSEDSPYHDFFQFYPDGSWPYNTHYDGWWGHDTLPKLNYEGSDKLFEYIMQIGKKWVSAPYNVDGWRLDVAADLGHSGKYNTNSGENFETRSKRRIRRQSFLRSIMGIRPHGFPETNGIL